MSFQLLYKRPLWKMENNKVPHSVSTNKIYKQFLCILYTQINYNYLHLHDI